MSDSSSYAQKYCFEELAEKIFREVLMKRLTERERARNASELSRYLVSSLDLELR